jgi:hypothetical protein
MAVYDISDLPIHNHLDPIGDLELIPGYVLNCISGLTRSRFEIARMRPNVICAIQVQSRKGGSACGFLAVAFATTRPTPPIRQWPESTKMFAKKAVG